MLTWKYSHMIGTTIKTQEDGRVFYSSLYEGGNADLVEVYNDPQFERSTLMCYVIDLDHAKRMKNCTPYKGIKVLLMEGAFPTKAELKKVAWELLILGANVELI